MSFETETSPSTEPSAATELPRGQRRPGRPPGSPKPPGSGRKKGVPNKSTREIREVAQKHGTKAIRELVKLMTKSENEATRLKAAQELLDRGYGRPVTPSEISGKDGDPITSIERVIVDPNDMGDRELSRRLAFLLTTGAHESDPG